ncbi:similar to Saccharomyces cerevisiae YLR396C VPS33 ATP-binding protein that is a subunit of the HOPS complex and of the CORVET tethering complex [Maudiozyma saulgeensis]|uniref:Similar to Saccharomyces cerevisiae YLR396C VPS33 ATP-binding protein that is a subunit of the HOPS complex and of the CORVET tethering complex n=1 Tax=Maudiozyma saulgeensis TaxID=1789683 RepID=A0A1X7RAM8_9SACH|nr:similar to Saccharomyces cerevisiae YLR396C VPS33 ATP-binding protein that is a subunit of the HOPS complex and of the CORVET tethering complex [Kazachstania saulgeensis]
MKYQWNTRKFKDVVLKRFCDALTAIGGPGQVLIIQPDILPVINSLLSFTKLTEETPVKKILLLDDQLTTDLTEILETIPDVKLVFLIDIRVDLKVPTIIESVLGNLELTEVDVMYCAWETDISNGMTNIPHSIQSQLQEYCQIVRIIPWEMVTMPQFDDDFICPHLLYNSDNDSLYAPFENSMKDGTREVLLDNMVNCVQTLLIHTNTTVTNTVTLGNLSQKFAQLLKSRIKDNMTHGDEIIFDSLHGKKAAIDIETDMIVIEREMDPITPLLTELTYFGLLNDFYKFDSNGTLIDKEGNSHNFVNDDEIWNQLKFLNFGAMGPTLNKMAKELQTKYDARHEAETVGQIKTFVDSLGTLQQEQKLLKMHTTLSSDILEEVENNDSLEFDHILELEQDILLDNLGTAIAMDRILTLLYEDKVSMEVIIRLICLLSLCKNGLKDNEFDTLKKELIDTYGIEILFKLEWLTRNGLFMSKSLMQSQIQTKTALKKEYRHISKWLDTVPNEEDGDPIIKITDPREPTFAYCGASPLSVRLIQSLYDRTVLSKNYSTQQPFMISREPSSAQLDNLAQQIYGQADIITQFRWVPEPTARLKRIRAANNNNNATPSNSTTNTSNRKSLQNKDIVMIVCLGGITPGEVALLKFLQTKLQQRHINKRFIIIADGIVRHTSQ